MFSPEGGPSPESQELQPNLHIEDHYADFLPEEFTRDPKKYIEEHGVNFKSGDIQYHDDGSIREDPTASKFLPEWQNAQGETIQAVSKKVNMEKVRTGTTSAGEKFADPLLEYKMMALCRVLDLPAAKPIGFVNQGGNMFTLMEQVQGYTWTRRDKDVLGQEGLTAEDQESIREQIEDLMSELKTQFDEFGIYRTWKHKDMVVELDTDNKKVNNITPVDWEKSHLDVDKLTQRIASFSPEQQQEILDLVSLKT